MHWDRAARTLAKRSVGKKMIMISVDITIAVRMVLDADGRVVDIGEDANNGDAAKSGSGKLLK